MKNTTIKFVKMHGLGNDFVIINAMEEAIDIDSIPIEKLAHRHTGIGFDQLLILEKSADAAVFCRIYNADRSEAEQCGNGLRCVSRLLYDENKVPMQFSIQTKAGVFPVKIIDQENIQISMGIPKISSEVLQIEDGRKELKVHVLSLGNPHAIIKVEDVDDMDIEPLAFGINELDYFSSGVNVGFLQIKDRHSAKLRTYERGAGETLACGSNACAAACIGILNQWLDEDVRIVLQHGALNIQWSGPGKAVSMTGPADYVYAGTIQVD